MSQFLHRDANQDGTPEEQSSMKQYWHTKISSLFITFGGNDYSSVQQLSSASTASETKPRKATHASNVHDSAKLNSYKKSHVFRQA